MSHLKCPLCGWNRAISNYDPSGFDDDITMVTMKSLGRHGFEVSEEFSILSADDPIMEIVADRIVVLTKLLLENGIIKLKDLGLRLSSEDYDEEDEDEEEKEDAEHVFSDITDTDMQYIRNKLAELSEAVEEQGL